MRTSNAASWMGTGRASEGPLPSWMAPPRPQEPSLTSWAAPSRDRGSINDPKAYEAVARSARPRISVLPTGDEGGERMPPPPSMPGEFRELARNANGQRELAGEIQEALDSMRKSLLESRRELLESSETELVKLAVAIAEKVVGRELHMDPAVVGHWAREGIEALGALDDAACIVFSRVAEVLMSSDRWKSGMSNVPEVIVDQRLDGFACEIRARYGRVDMSVTSRIGAAAEALGAAHP